MDNPAREEAAQPVPHREGHADGGASQEGVDGDAATRAGG